MIKTKKITCFFSVQLHLSINYIKRSNCYLHFTARSLRSHSLLQCLSCQQPTVTPTSIQVLYHFRNYFNSFHHITTKVFTNILDPSLQINFVFSYLNSSSCIPLSIFIVVTVIFPAKKKKKNKKQSVSMGMVPPTQDTVTTARNAAWLPSRAGRSQGGSPSFPRKFQ